MMITNQNKLSVTWTFIVVALETSDNIHSTQIEQHLEIMTACQYNDLDNANEQRNLAPILSKTIKEIKVLEHKASLVVSGHEESYAIHDVTMPKAQASSTCSQLKPTSSCEVTPKHHITNLDNMITNCQELLQNSYVEIEFAIKEM